MSIRLLAMCIMVYIMKSAQYKITNIRISNIYDDNDSLYEAATDLTPYGLADGYVVIEPTTIPNPPGFPPPIFPTPSPPCIPASTYTSTGIIYSLHVFAKI